MSTARKLTSRLLDDKTFHIEFQGYLSNHAKHAVVALHGLEASTERIQEYWEEYTHIVPYGYRLEKFHEHSGLHLIVDNWRDVLGTKTGYPALCDFFDSQERELGSDELVRRYAPVLIPGSAGALTHGIIHTGWALDEAAQSRWMLVEGAFLPQVPDYLHVMRCHRIAKAFALPLTDIVLLTYTSLAYMAYTFVNVHPERFEHGALEDDSPISSLVRMARQYQDNKIGEWVERTKEAPEYSLDNGFHPELYEAGFQWQVAKILEEGHHLFLCLPAWLDTVPLASDQDLDTSLEGVYKAFVTLYLVSAGQPDVDVTAETRTGSFLILHLITSLWGAEHILRMLPVASARRHALKCYWASMLAVALTSTAGLPPPENLEGTCKKFASGEVCEGPAWDDIVARACAEEEEHNIKLVHVCRKLWQRYDEWSGFKVAASTFTPTPDIGPGKDAFRS